MYHEIQIPGRDVCDEEEGYARFAVRKADFRAQLMYLKAAGFQGLCVSEAVDGPAPSTPQVVITFDDGCETDLTDAAPQLEEMGCRATFYVVAGWLGNHGHLSPAQLRELADRGFEIGCHSMTHPYLNDLGRDRLRTEIFKSKEKLEQVIGRSIDHFSCPGGRWSPLVARMAQEAGYRSVATSRIGLNRETADRFRLARVGVMRGTSLADFKRLCQGKGLLIRKIQYATLSLAKQIAGNRMYEKVRSALLRE
jgi:peptidoglycan/xylan/chitin deacetylase (PgdA/CDA1 family)